MNETQINNSATHRASILRESRRRGKSLEALTIEDIGNRRDRGQIRIQRPLVPKIDKIDCRNVALRSQTFVGAA